MFPFRRFRVDDESMRPTFEPGDFVLVNRWAYRFRDPRPGDLVVLRDPQAMDRFLVKRIAGGPSENRFLVAGDNEARSRDSRAFGPVGPEAIVGKVWLRLKP